MSKTLNIASIIFSVIAISAVAYNQLAPHKSSNVPSIPSETFLTPKDLGIQKYVFRTKPNTGELVKLVCEMRFNDLPTTKVTHFFHTDGQLHEQPVLLITKDKFSTFSELESRKERFNHSPPDNIEIKCGHFIKSFNHLHHRESKVIASHYTINSRGSELSSNNNLAVFRFLDNQEAVAQSADLTCNTVSLHFKMGVIPYQEAKLNHPDLSDMQPNKAWTAVFVDENLGQNHLAYQKASDTSIKAQLEYKR